MPNNVAFNRLFICCHAAREIKRPERIEMWLEISRSETLKSIGIPSSREFQSKLAHLENKKNSNVDTGEGKPQPTRVETYLTKLKNNRLIALLVVAGVVILAILNFTNNVHELWTKLFPPHRPNVTQRTEPQVANGPALKPATPAPIQPENPKLPKHLDVGGKKNPPLQARQQSPPQQTISAPNGIANGGIINGNQTVYKLGGAGGVGGGGGGGAEGIGAGNGGNGGAILHVDVDSSPINFGEVKIGSMTEKRRILVRSPNDFIVPSVYFHLWEITHNGQIEHPEIKGEIYRPDSFEVSAGTCAAGLAPHESCELEVAFSPKQTGKLVTSLAVCNSWVDLHGAGIPDN
jgi:hypothetical protein